MHIGGNLLMMRRHDFRLLLRMELAEANEQLVVLKQLLKRLINGQNPPHHRQLWSAFTGLHLRF